MDRTCEFVNICVLFDNGSRLQQIHTPLSTFSRRSQQISDSLRQKELLLSELEQLVITKSFIGDDTATQITTLIELLKKEFKSIEQSLQDLLQAIARQESSDKRQYQSHFHIIGTLLKTRCAKNAKRFHAALQRHTQMIKEQSSRRSRFSHGGVNPMVHLNAPLFTRQNAVQERETVQRASHLGQIAPADVSTDPSHSAGNIDTGTAPEPVLRRRNQVGKLSTLGYPQQTPQNPFSSQSMQSKVPHQNAQARHQDALQIENTIVEISGMYSRMATMVAEQGEFLERIDDNMDAAQMNVEAAQSELLKLYQMVSGNRSLILKIFLLLILLIVLFLVVF